MALAYDTKFQTAYRDSTYYILGAVTCRPVPRFPALVVPMTYGKSIPILYMCNNSWELFLLNTTLRDVHFHCLSRVTLGRFSMLKVDTHYNGPFERVMCIGLKCNEKLMNAAVI